MDAAAVPPTYRGLLRLPGFRRLAVATTLARVAAAMQALVLVLFVLRRFHSAPLAGLVVFLSLVPGIVISPLAGALLDRHRRVLLINVDYAIAALGVAGIAALDRLGHLPSGALLLIVSAGSLTNPLSNSGTRSLFPVIVPRGLWERANAIDSGAYIVAAVAGPALAGLLIGSAGPEGALIATAAIYVGGLVAMLGTAEPVIERIPSASLVGDALRGLRYVLGNPALRGLALTTSTCNIAFGAITVAMPVLLLRRYGAGDATVGLMWAVMGITALVGGALAGRMDSENREVWFIVAGAAVSVVATGCLLLAALFGGGVAMVALAMAVFGVGNGPFDIGLFSLRQRATAPAWMGRAFAVSMSLNFAGLPIGSILGGTLADRSLAAAFALAVAASFLGGVAAIVTLAPGRQRPISAAEYN